MNNVSFPSSSVKLFGDSGGEREDASSPLLSELMRRLSGPASRVQPPRAVHAALRALLQHSQLRREF